MPKRLRLLWLCLLIAACSDAERSGAPAQAGEGIDLSHHNGVVNWDALDREGLDFVYLKATEGRDHKDGRFQSNWREATQRGYEVGAYHFYLLCKDGAAQAGNFIQSVEVRAGTLAPAVDLEYAENCRPLGSREDTLAQLQDFLDLLEAEYGRRPVLYTTPEFHDDWIRGTLDGYPIWMRSLDGAPRVPATIWQYDMRGKLAGITGDVDRNRMMPAQD